MGETELSTIRLFLGPFIPVNSGSRRTTDLCSRLTLLRDCADLISLAKQVQRLPPDGRPRTCGRLALFGRRRLEPHDTGAGREHESQPGALPVRPERTAR